MKSHHIEATYRVKQGSFSAMIIDKHRRFISLNDIFDLPVLARVP